MTDKELKELYRYDQTTRTYHVDIELDAYRDVYNDWDFSPFVNRDLDEDLLDYLHECSKEISVKRNMQVRFFMKEELKDNTKEKRSKEGINRYFSYRIRKIRTNRWRLVRNSLIFGIIGALFLILSYLIELSISHHVATKLLAEGLVIGAWVAIWEIFSILFFQVNELNSKIRHYQRLKDLDFIYIYK